MKLLAKFFSILSRDLIIIIIFVFCLNQYNFIKFSYTANSTIGEISRKLYDKFTYFPILLIVIIEFFILLYLTNFLYKKYNLYKHSNSTKIVYFFLACISLIWSCESNRFFEVMHRGKLAQLYSNFSEYNDRIKFNLFNKKPALFKINANEKIIDRIVYFEKTNQNFKKYYLQDFKNKNYTDTGFITYIKFEKSIFIYDNNFDTYIWLIKKSKSYEPFYNKDISFNNMY